MAQITRRPFISHLRATATSHVVQIKKGKVKRSGAGLSFWFRPAHGVAQRSADRQQGHVAVLPHPHLRLPGCGRAGDRQLPDRGPQAGVGTRRLLHQPRHGQLDGGPARRARPTGLRDRPAARHRDPRHHDPDEALATGIGATRDAIAAGLDADERLRDTGVAIVGVRVLAIKPEAEMERALQTPTRESVQQEADRATYERRALAVESERTISENELQSKIELATREKDLLAQEGANARTRAEDAAAARAIADDAAARGERVLGDARAQAAKALVEAYNGADASALLARAAETAAQNIGSVNSITITPDMLSNFLGGARGDQA